MRSTIIMQWKDCRMCCAKLDLVHSHAPTTALMHISIIYVGSRNIAINNHDTMDRLLFVMCAVAHYSLICTANRINVDLNNSCGVGARCETVRSTIMMQQTDRGVCRPVLTKFRIQPNQIWSVWFGSIFTIFLKLNPTQSIHERFGLVRFGSTSYQFKFDLFFIFIFSVIFIILMDHIFFICFSKSGCNKYGCSKYSYNKAYCKKLVCKK